jgi:hypothetical protein
MNLRQELEKHIKLSQLAPAESKEGKEKNKEEHKEKDKPKKEKKKKE